MGQNIQAKAADKRSEQTYKDAEAVLHECIHIQQHLTAQENAQQTQLAELRQLMAVPAVSIPVSRIPHPPAHGTSFTA